MPTYLYRAVDLENQTQVEGAIDARDEREARTSLRSRGILTLSMTSSETEATANHAGLKRVLEILTYTPVKPGDLTIFTQQMAALVEAGLPIVEVMVLLEEQTSNPTLRGITTEIRKDLLGGMMLSEALARHPRVFSPLFVNLTQAGEISGQLDIMLGRLAEMLDKSLELKRKVKAALTYPAFVGVTLLLVIAVVLLFVVPVFQKLYASTGSQLPLPTRILLGLSSLLRADWYWILGGIVGGFIAYRWFRRTEVGRPIVDRIWLRIPLIGRLIREQTANTFTRAFATVYGAGVAILPALESCRRIVENQAIGEVLAQAEEGVKSGRSFSSGLQGSPYFPRILSQMLAVGESSGKLEEMAHKGVTFSDKEIDHQVKQVTSMLEPILTGVMGLMVTFIALALYLPLFDLPKILGHMGR